MWCGTFPCDSPQGEQEIQDIIDWYSQPKGAAETFYSSTSFSSSQQSLQTVLPSNSIFYNNLTTSSHQMPPTTSTSPEETAMTTFQYSPILPGVDPVEVNPRSNRIYARCECSNCRMGASKSQKLHICDFANCKKLYKKTSQLRSHLIGHTGVRPYSCPTCNRAFARSDELRRHTRIHTGEKNHPCKECGKKFSRSDHLKKHVATHANPKRRSRKVTLDNLNIGSPQIQKLESYDISGQLQMQHQQSKLIKIPVADTNTFVEISIPEMNFNNFENPKLKIDTLQIHQLESYDISGQLHIQYQQPKLIKIPVADTDTFVEISIPETNFENPNLPIPQGQEQIPDFDFLSQLQMEPTPIASVPTDAEFFIFQISDETSYVTNF